MAVVTRTFTATLQTDPIMANHSGVSFSRGVCQLDLTSLTDTTQVRMLVAKIPAGAVVLNWWGKVGGASTRTGGSGTFIIGLAQENAGGVAISQTFATAFSNTATAYAGFAINSTRALEGYNTKISVSDDNANQYVYIAAQYTANSASATASNTIFADLTVMYTMDSQVSTGSLKNMV